MDSPRSAASRQPVLGDIVVTKVSDHYHISRVQDDGDPFVDLTTRHQLLADALDFACRSVTGLQRVYMYPSANSQRYVSVDCAKPR